MPDITCVSNNAIFLIYEWFEMLLQSIEVDSLYCEGFAFHAVQLFCVPLVDVNSEGSDVELAALNLIGVHWKHSVLQSKEVLLCVRVHLVIEIMAQKLWKLNHKPVSC